MCIFLSDAAVEKTIIAAWQQNGKHYMAYQNKVKSKTANVMMLPIPTNQTFKFHDTTPYKGFLSEIGKAVYADHMKGSRDLGAMPKGFERVGQYQFAQVQPEYVETTLNTLNQPIQTWLDRMLEAYNGWTWLFCIMDADTSMDSQPLLVEFDSIFPDKLYLPMMDVHGNDEVQPKVERNHILCIGSESTLPDSVIKSVDLEGFPFLNLEFGGAVLEGIRNNGDGFAYQKDTGKFGLEIKNFYNRL
jgi:hypothetical protein